MAIAVSIPDHLRNRYARQCVIHRVEERQKIVAPVKKPPAFSITGDEPLICPKKSYASVADRNRDICIAYLQGATLDQCAEMFETSVGSVRHALKSNNVKPRSRSYRS